jgi:hypothetical protein
VCLHKHCNCGKVISIACTWCVSVFFVIHHAQCICCIILSSVACLLLPYLSTLCHKRHDCLKKTLWNIKCVFWFYLQLLSEIFLILRRMSAVRYYHTCTYIFTDSTCYSCQIWMKSDFFDIFFKNIKFYENPTSGSWVVACRWIYGQTDRQTGQN